MALLNGDKAETLEVWTYTARCMELVFDDDEDLLAWGPLAGCGS
jgi:hypothetical protein